MTKQGADGDSDALVSSARGGLINLVGAGSNAVLSFILVVIVARTMHAAGTGAFFEATALFLICGSAALFGSDNGLIRFIARDRALHRIPEIGRLLVASLLPTLLAASMLAGLMYLGADRVATLLVGSASAVHQVQLAHFLRSLAPLLPILTAYLTLLAATRGYGTMLPNSVIDKMVKPALQPLLVLLAVLLGLGADAVSLAWGLPILLGVLPASVWLRHTHRRVASNPHAESLPVADYTRPAWRAFWAFSAPRGLASILQVGLNRLDILLLGALTSTATAGVYVAVTRYTVAGRLFTGAIAQGMQPNISMQFVRGDRPAARELFQVSTAWSAGLAWPIYLTLAVFSPLLVRVFGGGFHSGALALQILVVGELVGTACGAVDVVLLMAGRSMWNLLNTAIALSSNVALNLLLIPRYGLTGAAVAWSVAMLAANVVPLVQIWLRFRIHPFGRELRDVCLASLLCFGGLGLESRLLFGVSVLSFAIFTAVAVPTYLVFLWWDRERLHLDTMIAILRRSNRSPIADGAAVR